MGMSDPPDAPVFSRADYDLINFGPQVLYTNATGLEKALADIDVKRLIQIRAELIRDNWDPFKAQVQNLPFLAFAMGVSLWDDTWSEGVKRSWVANQWEFKARRGTKRGIKMALALWGFELLQALTPPQGFYASPKIGKTEYDAWVHLMPELRIFHSDLIGELGPNEFVAGPKLPETLQQNGASFAGEDACATNDGPYLYGRKAVLRVRGHDIPLKLATWTTTNTQGEIEVVEQISTVGHSLAGFFAGYSFVAPLDFAFAGATDVEAPKLYTTQRNVAYQHSTSELALTALTPTLTPFTPRFEVNSDVGDGGPYFFEGDFVPAAPATSSIPSRHSLFDPPLFESEIIVGTSEAILLPGEVAGIAGQDRGGLLLADRMFLLDPDVTAPMTSGWSFAGVDRTSMPAFTAELLIDLHTHDSTLAAYADVESYAGQVFAMEEDMVLRDNALDAVLAAGALRDTLLVDTAPLRPRTFADPVTDVTTFDEWAPSTL